MTLHDQDEYRAAAKELGAKGFVAKRDLITLLMPLVHALFGDLPSSGAAL